MQWRLGSKEEQPVPILHGNDWTRINWSVFHGAKTIESQPSCIMHRIRVCHVGEWYGDACDKRTYRETGSDKELPTDLYLATMCMCPPHDLPSFQYFLWRLWIWAKLVNCVRHSEPACRVKLCRQTCHTAAMCGCNGSRSQVCLFWKSSGPIIWTQCSVRTAPTASFLSLPPAHDRTRACTCARDLTRALFLPRLHLWQTPSKWNYFKLDQFYKEYY
jgi:hypothetical protein